MDAQLHFPHILLSGAEQVVWEQPNSHPSDLFETLQKMGWAYTRYISREPLVVSEDKVHFAVTYQRCSADHAVISTHLNLWIVTHKNGRWGISLRSY